MTAKGLTVYPGLIDLGTTTGVDAPMPPQPANPRTTEEIERWKRTTILRPQVKAADHVRVDAPELDAARVGGITSILATPAGYGGSWTERARQRRRAARRAADWQRRRHASADSPSCGRRWRCTSAFGGGGVAAAAAYPVSLMGVIAFVRQSFLDAQHYGWRRSTTSATRRSAWRGPPTSRRSTRCSRRSPASCRWRSRPVPRARSCARSRWRRSSS